MGAGASVRGPTSKSNTGLSCPGASAPDTSAGASTVVPGSAIGGPASLRAVDAGRSPAQPSTPATPVATVAATIPEASQLRIARRSEGPAWIGRTEPAVDQLGLPQVVGDGFVRDELVRPVVLIGRQRRARRVDVLV